MTHDSIINGVKRVSMGPRHYSRGNDERTKEIEYTIFEKFEITIDIHVTKMRDSISRVTIDKKDVLVNVGFVPGIGLEGKVEGIYWIRNNELYSRI